MSSLEPGVLYYEYEYTLQILALLYSFTRETYYIHEEPRAKYR